jgi:hypothetical protein
MGHQGDITLRSQPLAPGMNTNRLVRLMGAAIKRCELDLNGFEVLTEAASGGYVVTPVLAAVAGAKYVFAVTKPSRHGTVDDIRDATMVLARSAGVEDKIEIVTKVTAEIVGAVDIVTNSGHVRPIDAAMIGRMKATAVVPLMYEAWELRASDVDIDACREHGIAVAGTNERHPAIDVFSYLGIMAVKLLLDAGVVIYGSRLLVVCDNPFAPYIVRCLRALGAEIELIERFDEVEGLQRNGPLDALLLAVNPHQSPPLGFPEANQLADRWPGTVLAQFWGDVDRDEFGRASVPCWPIPGPAAGHMGILPSAVGAEPVVRLQAGGLKVAEVLIRAQSLCGSADWDYVDELKTT